MTLSLTKEIVYYSLIPALVAFIFIIIAYFLCLKKENRNSNYYNYFVKMMIAVMICATLPLITGYTFWVIEMFSNHNVLLENISYVILIVFLSLFLLTLLVWVYLKTLYLAGLINEDVYSDK